MDLFSGNACFSPRVPAEVQKEWVQNGGSVANIHADKTCATYIFCDGEDDPWFSRLFQRSMAIFHWSWISAVVAAQFRLPISAYVLDGYSSAPPKPIRISEDEGDPHEDADRTLLSTPLRDLHAHTTLSPSAKSKSESVDIFARNCPEIDLRVVSRTRLGRGLTLSRRQLAPLRSQDESDELHERTLVHRTSHEDVDNVKDAFSALASSSGVISVSDALEALQHISTEKAAQFTPGTTYLDKEFRCWYT
ncbi:hypothetical protein GSI_04753 [Ganoderma sinense ZZ0214-1]|uniref:BRCT domain-containing protein n=1 Tax=Ganoderma sinense ZZ0214-1 TaxID=1077348 RepID=A0A2G8SHR5_9APHY|nr:hypothetical protein GSI_04753 [Ganoderma sinense ZZ0214-1]